MEFERTWKPLDRLPEPRLIDAEVRADLEPERRAFGVSGTFTYVNNHAVPVDSILVSLVEARDPVDTLAWGRPATLVVNDSTHGVRLFRLETPLAPNDTIALRYRAHYQSRGFPIAGTDTAVASIPIRNAIAANGTFVNCEYFPVLGYQSRGARVGKRPPQGGAAAEDAHALARRRGRARGHLPRHQCGLDQLQATVSTAPDQIALAPGYLEREYQENGRRVFEYRADEPMLAFFTFLSARYEVRRDTWNDVELEIYLPQGARVQPRPHDGVDEGVARGLLDPLQSLPVQAAPDHRVSALLPVRAGIPGTVPFGENIGFILRARHEQGRRSTRRSTSPPTRWRTSGGSTRSSARTCRGPTMMSEGLAEYSAHPRSWRRRFGRDNIQKFLALRQLDRYLSGRAARPRREKPLMLVENQPYIHYNKGSLALYALRDYIGDDAMNGRCRGSSRQGVPEAALHHQPRAAGISRGGNTGLGAVHHRRPVPHHHALGQRGGGGDGHRTADSKYDVAIKIRSAKFRADSLETKRRSRWAT